MRPATVSLPAIATFLVLAGQLAAQKCGWEFKKQTKVYNFELGATLQNYPHGIRSEDGFYKVSQQDTDDDSIIHTFWFQFCESMKFNHDRPQCFKCETCGGPEHCGETCSALHAISYPGFSVCETLGFASNTSFSLMDSEDPGQGITVIMSAITKLGQCSLSVSILCDKKNMELPSVVNHEPSGKCQYNIVLKHPAGCPAVVYMQHKGLGWFSILVIFLVCGFAVYMIGGIIYRRQGLGVTGWEAIPHLDFWRSLPLKIQSGAQQCIGWTRGLYRRFTEPSYVQVG